MHADDASMHADDASEYPCKDLAVLEEGDGPVVAKIMSSLTFWSYSSLFFWTSWQACMHVEISRRLEMRGDGGVWTWVWIRPPVQVPSRRSVGHRQLLLVIKVVFRGS